MPSQGGSESVDVVVVGAGTAGSVVVRRLVDGGHRVAVIEAGPSDDRAEIDSPFGSPALIGSELDWAISTVPQAAVSNRVLYHPRGKALGGTTVLYGMFYIRGARSDYDTWAANGAAGWAWSDVEPYFRRLEDYDGAVGADRGVGGPMHVHQNTDPDPLVRAFVDAAVQAGYPYNDDYNVGDSRGASFAQVRLKSADPREALLIDPGILSDPRDLESIVDHVEALREVARQPALAEWIKSERYPGPHRTNREGLREYARAAVDAGQHQVGTARIGSDPLAVVDSQLLVRGVEGLRIADASVMPIPPAGNTAGPTLMIGERAADFILKGR